jgi:cation:H+ antiporter
VTASVGSSGLAFPLAAFVALGASFLLVSRLERLSNRLRLSEAMLGLVVALAADAPEIASAISASMHGEATISTGVVLGSNVFNLAALLGLGAIVARRIALHRRVIVLEGTVGAWVALVTFLVVAAKWGAGVGLVLVLVVVVPYVVVSALSPGGLLRLGLAPGQVDWLRGAIAEEEEELALGIHPVTGGRLDATVALASLAVVVVASVVMERAAETLGRHFGVSSLVVGGVVLAAVTSLPNAVGAVYLAVRGRGAATLSEAMNSNMLNVLIGLLLPGVFLGLGTTGSAGLLIAAWYVGMTVLCLLMAYISRGLTRQEGVLIVIGYAVFVVAAVALR